jgi:hypothetical protein
MYAFLQGQAEEGLSPIAKLKGGEVFRPPCLRCKGLSLMMLAQLRFLSGTA